MSLFLAWVVFPLILLALCGGLGLLVDRLCGRRIPGALIAPAGLAAIIVVAELTTISDATAGLTVPLVVLLAVLGFAVSLPWRFGRPEPWALGAALAVFAVFAAPIVLSGNPTFAGYVKLDDTATWITITDRAIDHGRSVDGLDRSTYRATLNAYPGDGYPIGANLPWGVARALSGQDAAWNFQSYLAFLAAMLALSLGAVCRPFIASPRLRALVAFIASQAALFYGFYLWGGMKELAAAALIALAAGLLSLAARPAPGGPGGWSDARATLPLATAAAAIAATLSPAGLLWIGPLLLAGAYWALRDLGPRQALVRAAWLLGLLALLSIPLFTVGRLTPPVEHAVTDSTAVLNLIQPLHPLQVLGIWPSGDFRFRPDQLAIAWLLAALAAGLALLGLYFALRDRAWSLAGYVGTSVLGCLAITVAASPWVDAKAMATAAPAFLAAATIGAAAVYQRGLRLEGGVLLALLAGGVLWSNALAYGGADLAPYDQLAELQEIGNEYAGQGPALMTEYNPYGARHFLREMDGESASELRERLVPLRTGGEVEKGEAVDLDELDLNGLFEFRTLVLRRSPTRSRPPSPYRLVREGEYYEVWQRPADFAELPPDHLPLGDESDPAAVPSCAEVSGLGQLALLHHLQDVRLIAARHAPVYDASDGILRLPRPGLYGAWLGGSVRGSVELLVDGRKVGEARQQISNEGGFVPLGETPLSAGVHRVQLRFGGADLHPGSGGFPRPETGPLLFSPADQAGALVSVPIERADELCGKRWDWVEAVGSL